MKTMILAAFFTAAVLVGGCSSTTEPNVQTESTDIKPRSIQGGNGANVFEQTFSTNVKNKCTNQSIRMKLVLRIVERENDNNGKSHAGRHVNLEGTGKTNDGTEYELNTVSNMMMNSDSDSYPYTETMLANSKLRASGPSGTDYRFHSLMHVTYNANGEVTADISEIELDCDE